MNLPSPSATRLQNFVWTMRAHGNSITDLNIPILLKFNPWLSESDLREEYALQENGSRKLPEEVAAHAKPETPTEEVEE